MIAFALAASLIVPAVVPSVPAGEARVAEGNTDFAFALYQRLAGESPKGNLFLSPYSISSALAMTYAGARGPTAAEMASVLHFGRDADALHSSFSRLREQLASPADNSFELAVANRLFPAKGFQLLDSFVALARDRYAAPVEQLDFAGATEASRQRINSWVAGQTHDRIRDLLTQGVIDADTAMVLVNAIYFKGVWQQQFDKRATGKMAFSSQGKTLNVPFMTGTVKDASYGEVDGVQLLELPYKGGQLSMLVALPEGIDGLAKLEGSLTRDRLDAWLRALAPGKVQVYLPKYKLESRFELGKTLQPMGMKLAFGAADFSGMAKQGALAITRVIHKAFVEVNEEGTEAAAATAVIMSRSPEAPRLPVFRADHPFLFAIRHNPSGSILFLGRVVDPRG